MSLAARPRPVQEVSGKSFKIDHRKSGPVTVMDISGKIVLGDAANRLLETAKELISQGERNLLFNLAEVPYLDSAGLGAFVKCYNTAKESQGHIKLVNVSGKIRDLLRITKLQSLFEIFDDETTAVKSYH
jgi:anti-sigma B factor antagonist